jgi:hypothetical protein
MRRAVVVAATLLAAPAAAEAFCGFYVSGAGAELFNNATQVVLMRHGTRTVLSMQNNYQGPPEDFAMVVPVPVVLQEENVKTLPREIFKRIDELDAPRLVEYWEIDPCWKPEPDMRKYDGVAPPSSAVESAPGGANLGVKVEARFTVGEYQIVILSAKDSTGLDTWLRQEKYQIPAGAEPYLKPYVESGSKFFVAKVDIEKVAKVNGRAMLSPLRFHYDTEQFNLPIRLGLMNSAGTQDLIVHILAPNQRYEAANYPNVTIPTNLDVVEEARDRFGEFYAALFDRTLEKHPKAVVTEYSWASSSCDPCPTPALDPAELQTLGADVIGTDDVWSFVLTRLHARYGKDAIGEDLVFRAAPGIVGGREQANEKGVLEVGGSPSSYNNFQARYAVRHPWTGKIYCHDPIRGRWGGPPAAQQQIAAGPRAATDLAFAPRGKIELASMVLEDVEEIGVTAGGKRPAGWVDPRAAKGCCGVTGSDGPPWAEGLLVIGAVWLGLVRRRRRCAR